MVEIWAVEGIPEVVAGGEIAGLIIQAISTGSITGDGISTGSITEIEDGDIGVVTSKIVSKAEGRSVQASDREDAITSQTGRVVATRGNTRIVENPLGLVLEAAGVDSSNTPEGTVILFPEAPMPAPGRFAKLSGATSASSSRTRSAGPCGRG